MNNDDATKDAQDEGGPANPPREPSEGVRILGATEASEATGRHEVVRRGRLKRYGDRPDAPSAESDLPRITISSTEEPSEGAGGGDRFGAVPVVPSPVEDSATEDRPPAVGGTGNVRAAADEPVADEPMPGEPMSDQPTPGEKMPERPMSERPKSDEPTPERPRSEPTPDEPAPERPRSERPMSERPKSNEPASDGPMFGEPEAFEPEADDTFVLPHWTEPATGQVPSVVADAEDEPPGSTDDDPRWRDESDDRGAGFDDLTDDAPRLGALSGAQSGTGEVEEDGFFDDEADRDPFDAFGPEVGPEDGPEDGGEDEQPPRRREQAPRRRRKPPGDSGDGGKGGSGDRNLPVAVGVGVGLVVVGLLCFYLGTITTMLLATVVVVLAGLEYFTAVRDIGYNPASLVGLVALGALIIGPALFGLAAYPVVLGITVLVGLVWYLMVAPGEGSVPNLGITLLGVMWIGLLASFAGLFLGLGDVVKDRNGLDSNPGIGVLIAVVIVAVAYDIGGYFIGRQFGRTPLSGASPNKTQEGFAGGIVSAVVVTTIVVSFIDPIGQGIVRTFVFALICALAAPVGDLCESFVKRDLGIKDMGTVLPGHGGVLDRFDSMLFVLPVAYFVSLPLGIWSA